MGPDRRFLDLDPHAHAQQRADRARLVGRRRRFRTILPLRRNDFAGPGFAAVWHMETNHIRDATGNGYHAQRIPVPAAVRTVPGVVGPAQRFNGRVGNDNRTVVGPALRVPTAFTVSA